MNGNVETQRNTGVQIGLSCCVALGVGVVSHGALQQMAGLSSVHLGILVVLRLPLEILAINLPAVADPGVDRLDQVEIVGSLNAKPRGEECTPDLLISR